MILAINTRYFPAGVKEADPAGVTCVIREMINELKHQGKLTGLLLFERCRSWPLSEVRLEHRDGIPAAIVPFNFEMLRGSVANVKKALASLTTESHPFVYSLSGVYAPFLIGCNAVFTHHEPFVDEISSVQGHDDTVTAYLGGPSKMKTLSMAQETGLQAIAQNPHFCALEISPVQVRKLHRWGIPEDKVFYSLPPQATLPERQPLSDSLVAFMTAPAQVKLFTACARIDRFKNLPELADAAEIIASQGLSVNLCMIAGTENQQNEREALVKKLAHLSNIKIMLHPSLNPGQLRSLFDYANKADAIFCFPSFYELLGLTLLQARQNGCLVLCRDEPEKVGASNFIPKNWRYTGEAAGLASKVLEVINYGERLPPAPEHESASEWSLFIAYIEKIHMRLLHF